MFSARSLQAGPVQSEQVAILNHIALVHEVCPRGRITSVNAQFCKATGFGAHDLVGATHSRIQPALGAGTAWIELHAADPVTALLCGETLNRKQNGDEVWLSSTIAPKFGPDGRLAGYYCVSFDVTESRKLKTEMEQNSKLLQLGQLTATVAHEIRNPLGAIRTAAFVLERRLKGQVEGVEPQIERINNGIRRCDKIITELLDFSRKKSLKVESAPVDGWVSDVIKEECRSLPRGGAAMFKPGMADLAAQFDPDQMRQVLINLMNNACDAMTEKVASGATDTSYVPELTIATRQDGRFVEIRVTDNGPGIEEKTLKRIREPLFTTKSYGVGLGIPAIEKILLNHGGCLNIESVYGEGATMTARFLIEIESNITV